MMVLHVRSEIDLFGFDATTLIFYELHGPSAGPVGRSREHQAILENRRRAVYPGGVGWAIVPPEELAVRRGHADECVGGQLHILSLTFKIDRDHRRVGRSSTTAPAT